MQYERHWDSVSKICSQTQIIPLSSLNWYGVIYIVDSSHIVVAFSRAIYQNTLET